ncbi:uncharacterized protein LOC129920706 [Episyrphus balteatus]|uniref:uncharacterized protein LOC129920706 n=1 Tax=Episyrphus balteatus TaxID=286459 RepID=UPI002485C440|nr:uncharacterized protein LOC129920706 [Episyrphus balteatus]
MELSQYAKNLDPLTKTRYIYKIEDVGKDPYLFSFKSKEFPLNVTFSKIYEFLITGTSAYTGNFHKNSNSLTKADELFRGGWLKELGGTIKSSLYVVLGKVLHSQRLNEKPLEAWVIIDNDGTVDSAHCQCKAGLYETCTHIGVILFGLQSIASGCSSESVRNS